MAAGQPVSRQGVDQLLPELFPAVDSGGKLALDALPSVEVQIGEPAGGGIGAGLLPEIPKGLQGLELVAVVGIQEGDELPLGLV